MTLSVSPNTWRVGIETGFVVEYNSACCEERLLKPATKMAKSKLNPQSGNINNYKYMYSWNSWFQESGNYLPHIIHAPWFKLNFTVQWMMQFRKITWALALEQCTHKREEGCSLAESQHSIKRTLKFKYSAQKHTQRSLTCSLKAHLMTSNDCS